MAVTIKKTPAQATITQELKNKGETIMEDTKNEIVEAPSTRQAPSPLCEVGFETSFTKNLGNYQSLKVGVHIKIPCLHAEIDQVFDYATNWADSKMQKLLDEAEA